ncbi:MAG: hypothetical protein IJ731_01980 [Eubacterium sp.]|nr:hypothetical protein [Eubacterium sp.]
MRLDTTRRIIVIILEIVMAICTVVFLFSAMMSFTLGDKNYFINQFADQDLVSECNNQLNIKYEALSFETSIPARVYERVETDYPTDEALRQAALSLFSEENETLYSENKVNYFYELSLEYLDGNDMSYKKEDIKRAAEKAARIYSDTVGIHNAGGIEARITAFSKVFPQATIISFIIAFFTFPSIMLMYKRKKGGYFNAIGGILAGTLATALGSLLSVVFGLGTGINILPEIHKQAMLSTSIKGFLILTFLSLVLTAASISVMRVVNKRIQDED